MLLEDLWLYERSVISLVSYVIQIFYFPSLKMNSIDIKGFKFNFSCTEHNVRRSKMYSLQ